jgi:general secretion pathway protein I
MKTIRLPDARSERAFTLLEVLVALLILSVALTAMSVTMGRMFANASLMRERTYASWIAQNLIVQLRAEGTTPDAGTDSGEIEFAGVDWAWETEISKTGIDNLLRVDVSISHPGEEDRIKQVTGFVGEPAMPGVADRLSWGAPTEPGEQQ